MIPGVRGWPPPPSAVLPEVASEPGGAIVLAGWVLLVVSFALLIIRGMSHARRRAQNRRDFERAAARASSRRWIVYPKTRAEVVAEARPVDYADQYWRNLAETQRNRTETNR